MKAVSILGCGWMGLPLAGFLSEHSDLVRGSTTDPKKLTVLKELGITPYQIECSPQIQGRNLSEFFQSEILYLNIPFRRNLKDPRYYQHQIRSVIAQAENSAVQWIIFAGSTSVYPDTIVEAKEDSNIIVDNERSQVLIDIEKELLDHPNIDATIIRFAGLYGPGRELGRFLAGKDKQKRGDQPVNLIHLDDCIEIVKRIIELNVRGEIFNACSDRHPIRKELYAHKARELNLPAPVFADDSEPIKKIVVNDKVKRILKYQFLHPDPLLS